MNNKFRHEIQIHTVTNGYVIKAGCKIMVIEGLPERACSLILEYLNDGEKAYRKLFPEDFARKDNGQEVPQEAPTPMVQSDGLREILGLNR